MSDGESGQNGGGFGEAAAQSHATANESNELHAAMRHENTINQGGVTDNIDATKYGGGKYDTVEALDNGYLELQSKFSQKMQSFTGAPDAGYEYAMPESLESTGMSHDTADPLVQAFAEIAKDSGMNQEMYEKCMDIFYDSHARAHESNSEDAHLASEDSYNTQINELGGNEGEVMARVEDMAVTMSRFGGVSEAEVVSVIEGIQTAEQLAGLEKILAASRVSAIPTSASGMPMSDGGIKDLMARMKTAPASEQAIMQQEIDSRLEQRYPGMAPMSGG